jgi:transposase
LSENEQLTLQRWARGSQTSQALALRARLILACAEGIGNSSVAERLQVAQQTVSKWRRRFVQLRLDGLMDQPRSGTPLKVRDSQIERVLALTLESNPRDGAPWSTRTLAKACGLSRSTVHRIWRSFAVQPSTGSTFRMASRPLREETVSGIAGLYLGPPVRVLALCVDGNTAVETSHPDAWQLVLDAVDPPDKRQRTRTHDGLVPHSLWVALDRNRRKLMDENRTRHRIPDLLRFLTAVDEQVESRFQVHLILDRFTARNPVEIHRWLAGRPRFFVHFVAGGSSWIESVERWFERVPGRGPLERAEQMARALEHQIRTYLELGAGDRKPFVWMAARIDRHPIPPRDMPRS